MNTIRTMEPTEVFKLTKVQINALRSDGCHGDPFPWFDEWDIVKLHRFVDRRYEMTINGEPVGFLSDPGAYDALLNAKPTPPQTIGDLLNLLRDHGLDPEPGTADENGFEVIIGGKRFRMAPFSASDVANHITAIHRAMDEYAVDRD